MFSFDSNIPEKILSQATFMVCAMALVTSCGQKKPMKTATDSTAIKVGQQSIDLRDLQADLDDLSRRRNPEAQDPQQFISGSVERLTALERAHELGLDRERDLRRQWENLLIGRLYQQELEKKLSQIEVSDAEIEAYYETQKSSYGRPAQIHIALLHLATSPKQSEENRRQTRERMQSARKLATDIPTDIQGFGKLAMEYSEEATSRFKGGDIGWLQEGASQYRWPREVVKAAFELQEIGALSEVIEAEDGCYLLKKLDFRNASTPPLEGRFRSSIRNSILDDKRKTLEKELKESWSKAYPAIIHQEVIKQLSYKKQPILDQNFTEP